MQSQIMTTLSILSSYIIDEVSELISVEVLFQLIQTSMSMTLVADALKKRTGKSDVFNIKLLPSTSAVITTFLHHQAQTTSEMRADEYLKGRGKIEGILCAWGLELHPILGDGNCQHLLLV